MSCIFFSCIQNSLSEKFEVEGIPTLAIIDGKTGSLISEDATGDVDDSDDFPSNWNNDPINITGKKIIVFSFFFSR